MKINKILLTVLLMNILCAGSSISGDLITVQPVTDQILQVTYGEGHIDYFGKGENRYNGNTCYYSALNVTAATDPANYSITSSADSNYSDSVNPINIGRKRKGVDFNNLYDANEPRVLFQHWIYIELPHPLVSGKTYTVTLNNIAKNFNVFDFTFNELTLLSPTLHVNQIGFVPEAPKYAYLSLFLGDFDTDVHQNGGLELDDYAGNQFHVVRVQDDSVVFTGTIEKRTDKNTTSDFINNQFENKSSVTRADIWQCDFSAFNTEGEYRIAVEGIGCSYPFGIAEDVYREPFYYASKAMFTHRQGIVQDLSYYWEGLEYPRDHRTEDGLNMYYFPDKSGEGPNEITPNENPVTGIWGWYHDAGDWDGYSHHYRVPYTLLLLYDLKPENFGDGDLNNRYKLSDAGEWIDEGSNGIPDVLDEAAWLIRFYKRAMDSLRAQGYDDAGVPGYVGVDAGAGDGIPSWEDTRDMAVYGGDRVMMTFTYAACAGWLSLFLENDSIDGLNAQDWLNEAVSAYAWADSMGDANNAQMIAAAVLYRSTGKSNYQEDFEATKSNCTNWDHSNWSSIPDWYFAAWNYAKILASTHPDLDESLKQSVIDNIIAKANHEAVDPAASRGYRWALDRNNNWMLGTFSTPHIASPAMAYELTGDQKFLDACYTTCDYHLGGNEMNLVWLSMIGDNYERMPFHIDSWVLFDFHSKVYTEPFLPGIVPYGGHNTGDWMAGEDYTWVGDEDYSRSTAYPPIWDFPDAEARFQNRNCIAGSEYTVHQTINQAILAYGYLCGDFFPNAYSPNQPPTVSLNLQEGMKVPRDSALTLSVTASPDVRRVEFYYEWRYMGESRDIDNNFAFEWDLDRYNVKPREWLITAKAFDDRGMESRPSAEGERTIEITAPTSVQREGSKSFKFELQENYPNPFNAGTVIKYSLNEQSNVELSVYDVTGKKVTTLIDEYQNPGFYAVNWDAHAASSGLYFYQIKMADRSAIKKCMLIK